MAEEGSERELEEFLAGTGVFGGEPQQETEGEEVIHDVPAGTEPPQVEAAPPPPPPPSEGDEEVVEEAEQGEPHIVWATKKYGEDTDRWAKAMFDQERFIGQLQTEKQQSEEIAQQAIEYAQQVEAQTQASSSMAMPMSAAEEAWVEQSAANPAAYAYQAARQGNVQLYNAVLEQVALENPSVAAQVGTQVQMALQAEMQQLQAQQAAAVQNGAPQGNLQTDLEGSFQRVGVNVKQYGEPMWQKVDELGQYHPYTLAMLGGNQVERDLAVQAVYDLVRQGQTTTRRVGDETREDQIKREGELRRDAASVVTGSPHHSPPQESPLMEGMMAEWKRRGQWPEEE